VNKGSVVRHVALSLPLLGTVGVLVLVGWKIGPWPSLGIAAATVLLHWSAQRWVRPPRQIEGDPSASQRWRDERVSRVGQWLGTITGVWLGASVGLIALIVIAALLAR